MDILNEVENAYTVIYRIQYLQALAKLAENEPKNELYLSEYAYILDTFIDTLNRSINKIEQAVRAIN